MAIESYLLEQPNEGAKNRIADAINAAINCILQDGPSETSIAKLKSQIEAVLNRETTSSVIAAQAIESYHRNLYETIVQFKGFPVVSVVEVGGEEHDAPKRKSSENFSDAEFALIQPILADALARSIMVAADSAESFKQSEIHQSLMMLDEWAKTIPYGGTKEKPYRATARAVRNGIKATASWGKRFFIIHRPDFAAEARHIFACHRGAIAGKWAWSRYPECEIHRHIDGTVYLVRGSWAMQKGLLSDDGHAFTDEVTVPGTTGCCCSYEYLYGLRDIPSPMITNAGRTLLAMSHDAVNRTKDSLLMAQEKNVSWWSRLFTKRP